MNRDVPNAGLLLRLPLSGLPGLLLRPAR